MAHGHQVAPRSVTSPNQDGHRHHQTDAYCGECKRRDAATIDKTPVAGGLARQSLRYDLAAANAAQFGRRTTNEPPPRRQNQPPTILRRIELAGCVGTPRFMACVAPGLLGRTANKDNCDLDHCRGIGIVTN